MKWPWRHAPSAFQQARLDKDNEHSESECEKWKLSVLGTRYGLNMIYGGRKSGTGARAARLAADRVEGERRKYDE
jgi:hypothetical protein